MQLSMLTFAEETKTTIDENKIYAQSAVLMDADSGRILYEKNGEEQRPMASTTKIMTLIITLENADLDDTVTVSDYAASMPDVQLNMRKGETYRLEDLVYSLMLESHNDSAVAIAEHVGAQDGKSAEERTKEESQRAVANFCESMNQKARDIGCFHTCFLTPNGLDAEATIENDNSVTKIHSTTASDLARIMSYCITKSPQKEKFLEITRTPSYSFQDNTGSRSFSCNNHNAFLTMMEGALSGKTGFTSKAGYCYIGSLRSENRTYVVALLACGWPNHKGYKWMDMKNLMSYGISNYTYHDFNEVKLEENKLKPVPIINGQTKEIGETAYAGITYGNETISNKNAFDNTGILLREDEKIQVLYEIPDTLEAPVQKGKVVGTITYQVSGETWKIKHIFLKDTIPKIDLRWCLARLIEKYML